MIKNVIKLFRYYGGKYYLIPDILQEMSYAYSTYDIKCIVDVFGGSGSVILSIPQEWKVNRVYNDIDKRLYITLKVLQDSDKRKVILERLNWALNSRDIFNEYKNSIWTNLTDIEIAFRFLYLTAISFNADFKTYGHNVNEIRNKLGSLTISISENFKYLQKYLNVENADFRDTIKRYSGKHTLFYLDPPYLIGGTKYKYSFSIEDFKDLKNVLDNSNSYWLMNESERDFNAIKEIFGNPAYTKSYVNHVNKVNETAYRLEGFWKNY